MKRVVASPASVAAIGPVAAFERMGGIAHRFR
jgi:hypothetical protein